MENYRTNRTFKRAKPLTAWRLIKSVIKYALLLAFIILTLKLIINQ